MQPAAMRYFLSTHCLFRLLSLLLALSLTAPTAFAEDQWQDQETQEKQLKQLKQNISKIKNWIASAEGEQSQLEKDLKAAETQIHSKVVAIRSLQRKIGAAEKQIKQLEAQESNQLNALQQQQDLLSQQVRTSYAMGREQGVKLLLNAEDPLTLQRLMGYYRYLNDARGQLINRYRDIITDLKATRSAILVKNQELISARNDLATTRDALEASRQKRSTALASLKRDLKSKQNQLQRMRQNQRHLESLVVEVEKTIASLEIKQDARPFGKLRGKLLWPTNGNLIRSFGSSDGQFRSPGVFFRTPENEPVNAVHHGRVVFADWLRGFGLLMIIDHGDNYMSLYGFNEALLKEAGDWVDSGELIASAGNSGGQSQTGLYFEIRHEGKPSNPVRWLKKSR